MEKKLINFSVYIHLPYVLVILLIGIYSICMHPDVNPIVHISFIHSNKKLETIQTSIGRQMDKVNYGVAVLFSNENE